jgi:hypothetical protein
MRITADTQVLEQFSIGFEAYIGEYLQETDGEESAKGYFLSEWKLKFPK